MVDFMDCIEYEKISAIGSGCCTAVVSIQRDSEGYYINIDIFNNNERYSKTTGNDKIRISEAFALELTK